MDRCGRGRSIVLAPGARPIAANHSPLYEEGRALPLFCLTNSTPVSVTDRYTTRLGRTEYPPSSVRLNLSGSSTVLAIWMRAPLLVTLCNTQSSTDDVPRRSLPPLSTRERMDLRRSCIRPPGNGV